MPTFVVNVEIVRDIIDNDDESDTEAREMQPISQSQPNETNRSWLIGTPMYVVSWIALIGSVSAIFLGLNAPQGGWTLSFWCGAITAITAKRKNKSGWLWFFIGLIPIGFSLFFMIVFFKTLFLCQ